MVQSKHKGNAHEHWIATKLSEWSSLSFKRLPASGALRWGNGVWTYGDILPPDGWNVVIEAKHWATVGVEEALGTSRSPSGGGTVATWWRDQVLADAGRFYEDMGFPALPCLIYKQNRGTAKIVLPTPFFFQEEHVYVSHFDVCLWKNNRWCQFSVANFEEFLSAYLPAQFLSAAKKCSESHNGDSYCTLEHTA